MPTLPAWARQGSNPWGSFGYRTQGQTSPVTLFGGGDAGEQAMGQQFTYSDPRVRNLDATLGGGWGGGGGGMAQGWDMYTNPQGQNFYRIGDYNPNDDSQRRHGVNFDPSQVTYDNEMGYLVPENNINFDTSDYGISATMGWAVPALIGGAALFGGAGPFNSGGFGSPIEGGLNFNPTAGGTINPTGAFAGQGTGFTGFGGAAGAGSAGLLGGPSELASVGESGGSLLGSGSPASVTVNQPGLLSNLPNWAQNGLNNAFSNPLNALRLGQGIAGLAGAIRGGGSQPSTQSAKSGSGPAQINQVQRPLYTPNPYTQQQLEQYRRFQ